MHTFKYFMQILCWKFTFLFSIFYQYLILIWKVLVLVRICIILIKTNNQTYEKEFNINLWVKKFSVKKKDLVKEAWLSFVSGHTSTSFYSATFLASFMHKNLNHKANLPLQLGIFILAFWISITRITDYKHHVQELELCLELLLNQNM